MSHPISKMSVGATRKKGKEGGDFFETPEPATRALLRAESFPNPIWEPACGRGAISRVLERAGYRVRSSDIIDYGYGELEDFLTSKSTAPAIITNPPFVLAKEFMERGVQAAEEKLALLLPVRYLEGKWRARFFEESGLSRVHVFSHRVRFFVEELNRSIGMVAYAWYVWDFTKPPQSVVHLDWIEEVY